METEGSKLFFFFFLIYIVLQFVHRLMNKLVIKSVVCREFRPYSSRNKIDNRENIINRDFSTTGINQKWVTDIIYIHTIKDGWCYLVSVMDLNSRKIIGYSMSKNMDTTLAIKALDNALKIQKPAEGLILHSDLGSQYTRYEFSEYVKDHNLIHSFSGKRNPFAVLIIVEKINSSLYIIHQLILFLYHTI